MDRFIAFYAPDWTSGSSYGYGGHSIPGRFNIGHSRRDIGQAGLLPGEEGIWILVLGDMLVFALFFTVYLVYRADEVPLFDRSRRVLSMPIAVTNTLVRLTSSWFAFMGVEAVRTAR